MDDHLVGVLSNIGVISFVALSAYLLLLTGEISFGQQAFFALGAYAAGIATAMWGWPLTAALVGVPVARTLTLAFVLASAIGGLAGFLIAASEAQITPMFGMWATTKGLIAMMLGGLGSVPGALLGGLALGVVEAHAQWLFGPQIRDMIAWGLLFAVLALWPGGLMGGRRVGEAAAVQRRM